MLKVAMQAPKDLACHCDSAPGVLDVVPASQLAGGGLGGVRKVY